MENSANQEMYNSLTDYDNTLMSTARSQEYLQIAAAYVKVAMRSSPSIVELRDSAIGPINEIRARAFAVMMNLAFALEVMLKGKIPEDRLQPVLDRRDGHNLKVLYDTIPKIEQDQMRETVTNILVIDDPTFYRLLDGCKNGFVEWRYFFEERNKGKQYNYLLTTLFLYASVYYFITSESKDNSLLEPCAFKKQCYVGECGVLRTRKEIQIEYDDAVEAAIKDGEGHISDSDQKWLDSIKGRLQAINEEIRRIEQQYVEENTLMSTE